MDRETLEQIWRAAERTRSDHTIDFALLVDVAADVGSLSWRDASELALREWREEAARPMQLLEFVAELTQALGAKSVLDPWMGTPTILAAADEASGSVRSCGLVQQERPRRAAQRIAAIADNLIRPGGRGLSGSAAAG